MSGDDGKDGKDQAPGIVEMEAEAPPDVAAPVEPASAHDTAPTGQVDA